MYSSNKFDFSTCYDPDDYADYKRIQGKSKVILSLFDYTGEWARPWIEAGYDVYCMDIKSGVDIYEHCVEWFMENEIGMVYGILAAPPCTDFTSSCAWTWDDKDKDGRTAWSMELVYQVMRTVEYFDPVFWALENPAGRLSPSRKSDKALIPCLGKAWYWDPWEFGDPYTKKTGLWGVFSNDLVKTPVKPIKGKHGSWLMSLGGKSEKTKAARSVTPPGFSRAFFEANKDLDPMWNYNDLEISKMEVC